MGGVMFAVAMCDGVEVKGTLASFGVWVDAQGTILCERGKDDPGDREV